MRKTWVKRTLLGLVAFLVLFGLFGYFALPGILKSQAEKIVSEKLHRELSIERIEIQPFALKLQVYGAKLLEADRKTVFVSFEQLAINLSSQSLLRFAPVVKEVWLSKPYVHLERRASNQYNFDDLLALNKDAPPKEDGAPARFAVYNIRIEGGRIAFDDTPVGTKHLVSDLALGIPFVSSLPSQVEVFVEPQFSAKVNGAPLRLTGKSRPFTASRETSLALDLDDVDLTRYISYLPFKPRFKLDSATLDVHLTAMFREPDGKTPELALKGTTTLESVVATESDGKPLLRIPKLAVTLDDVRPLSPQLLVSKVLIDQAQIDLVKSADGSFNLEKLAPPAAKTPAPTKNANPPTAPGLRVVLGEFAIQNARVNYTEESGEHPLHAEAKDFNLAVTNTQLDTGKRVVDIASIASTQASFALQHNKSAVAQSAIAPVTAKTPRPASTPAEPGYAVNIASIGIAGWGASIEDQTLPGGAVTSFHDIQIAAKGISTIAGKSGHIDIRAGANKDGQLAIGGKVVLSPLHADLKLDLNAVDLMPVQPYVTDNVNVLVTRANLTTAATLTLNQAADGRIKGNFKGDVTLGNVATVDKVSGNDFLRWKSLAFKGMNVQFAPLSVAIEQVALNDFFARVIIDPSGRINLQDIARSPENRRTALASEEGTPPVAASTTAAAAPAPDAAITPVNIKEVKLQGGRVRFTDNFIKPNYTANLSELRGSVRGLSSESSSAAGVDLHGSVNGAPLNIAGSINPLKRNLFLDVKADVRGIELGPLSPYSGKYIGYGIEKGKLSFEVAYHLEDRKLEAQNRVILDQLTLGNKIESPTAVSLPIHLALTLLSDRNGVIDINLPIGGSLDDPQFSIGGIIFRAFVNLIAKAITSPFALLGSMFGGNTEELSWLEFDPGLYAIPTAGETKLESIAKALNDKPALKLEITGRYDPDADREGLKRAIMMRKVRALKIKQMVAKGESVEAGKVVIPPDEYPALLTKVYKDADFKKPRNAIGLLKDIPVVEMEKLLMDSTNVEEGDLVTLGNQRAQSARDWLVSKGQVAAERIYTIAAKPGASDKLKPTRVDFSLR